MIVTRTSFTAAVAAFLWAVAPIGLTASDELNRAKELYRTASYDEALSVLETIPVAESPDTVEVYEYRVFCLVALDRRDDARKAMGDLVSVNPTYAMSEAVASPRVRTMFGEVRRSLLPGITQRAYADAKTAFDKKDPKALAMFERVLTLLKDPDVASSPGLSDLATVAAGFRDLSKALAATPPPASPPVSAEAAKSAPTPAPPVMVPPVVIAQAVPTPQIREEREWDGEVEVSIDDKGRVTAARMTRPIHPVYDAQLLRAAQSWTYRPALRDGTPVQSVKQITIHVDTRPACSDRVYESCRPNPGGTR